MAWILTSNNFDVILASDGLEAILDHGSIQGLSDDDHDKYPLITNFEVDRATIASVWTDLTDAGATTLHKHDHGGQDGLGDDDHTQYVLFSDLEADRATINTHWAALTDGAETALHSHAAGAGATPIADTVLALWVKVTGAATVSCWAAAVACHTVGNRADAVLVSGISGSAALTSSGAGGLDTGYSESTGTWYYVHVICVSSGSSYSIMLSPSETAPNLPSGYAKHRCVGEVRNNGAGNITYQVRRNDKVTFYYAIPIFSAATIASSWTAQTLPVDVSTQWESVEILATSSSYNLGVVQNWASGASGWYMALGGPQYAANANNYWTYPLNAWNTYARWGAVAHTLQNTYNSMTLYVRSGLYAPNTYTGQHAGVVSYTKQR